MYLALTVSQTSTVLFHMIRFIYSPKQLIYDH